MSWCTVCFLGVKSNNLRYKLCNLSSSPSLISLFLVFMQEGSCFILTQCTIFMYIHIFSTLKNTPWSLLRMQGDMALRRKPQKAYYALNKPHDQEKCMRSFRVVLTLKLKIIIAITEPRVRRWECVLWKRERRHVTSFVNSVMFGHYSVFRTPLAWRSCLR